MHPISTLHLGRDSLGNSEKLGESVAKNSFFAAEKSICILLLLCELPYRVSAFHSRELLTTFIHNGQIHFPVNMRLG